MIKLSSSLLAADAAYLGAEVRRAADAGADELHFDVMDGHFVPNLSFGPHILKAVSRMAELPMDVHLMVSRPLEFVEPFARAGADILMVHAEAEEPGKALELIRALGVKSGISLKPGTPAEAVRTLLPLADRVLLMTVEPGFGGQKLIPEVLWKARQLREMGFAGEIEADGGINEENAPLLAAAGVEVLVMGTAFFGSEDPEGLAAVIHSLKQE